MGSIVALLSYLEGVQEHKGVELHRQRHHHQRDHLFGVSCRACVKDLSPLFNTTCVDRPPMSFVCTHLEKALEGGEHGPAVAREAVGRQPAVMFDYGRQCE